MSRPPDPRLEKLTVGAMSKEKQKEVNKPPQYANRRMRRIMKKVAKDMGEEHRIDMLMRDVEVHEPSPPLELTPEQAAAVAIAALLGRPKSG